MISLIVNRFLLWTKKKKIKETEKKPLKICTKFYVLYYYQYHVLKIKVSIESKSMRFKQVPHWHKRYKVFRTV